MSSSFLILNFILVTSPNLRKRFHSSLQSVFLFKLTTERINSLLVFPSILASSPITLKVSSGNDTESIFVLLIVLQSITNEYHYVNTPDIMLRSLLETLGFTGRERTSPAAFSASGYFSFAYCLNGFCLCTG